MNELEILGKLETGEIANLTLEELGRGAEFCLKISAKTTSVLAIVVAKLRQEYIKDAAEWSKFCKSAFNLEGSYLHHLHRIGKMMLSVVYNTPKVYTILFNLCFDKQLPITQIPAEQIDTFIKTQTRPLAKMTRAEVRAAVAVFTNKTSEAAKVSTQPALPGFDKWLENCSSFDAEVVINSIKDDTAAQKSFNAGILLTAAAVQYHLQRDVPDTVFLITLKKELLEEIQSIENVLAGSVGE